MHLPDNYRVVENGNGKFWVQKKWLFWWKDWEYEYAGSFAGGWSYAPSFDSLSEACEAALKELQRRQRSKENFVKENTIVGKYRC